MESMRFFKDDSIVQIIDFDTGNIIKEINKKGILIYTNLRRSLMPIIKYPVGDMAYWSDYNKRFVIAGRSSVGVRIGPVTFNTDDLTNIINFKSVI